MIKIVRFKDGSITIGNNNDDLKDNVTALTTEHGRVTDQYIVTKSEVDTYIKILTKSHYVTDSNAIQH